MMHERVNNKSIQEFRVLRQRAAMLFLFGFWIGLIMYYEKEIPTGFWINPGTHSLAAQNPLQCRLHWSTVIPKPVP